MGRTRSAERARSKAVALEEITRAMDQFLEVLALIEDSAREGFTCRYAARARAELPVRECTRPAFGDTSPELQSHRTYTLRVGNAHATKHSLTFIRAHMAPLEEKTLGRKGRNPK